MELSQHTSLKQMQTLSPQFILSQQLLQMPVMELLSEIQKELNQNPALEMEELAMCPRCHQPMNGPKCEQCGGRSETGEDETEIFIRRQMSDYDPDQAPYESGHGEEENDATSMAQYTSREGSFHDFLIYNFLASKYPEGSEELGKFLIYSINDDGFLECDQDRVKELFNVDDAAVEEVIGVIQSLDPVGVGARNGREALLIQMRALAEEGKRNELAEKMISEHFEDLGKGRMGKIAAELQAPLSKVGEAVDFIRKNLNPFPGRAYNSREPVQLARPAIIIRYDGRELSYIIVELSDFKLRVNRSYLEMYRNYDEHGGVSRSDMAHIRDYFRRAKFFVDSVESRRQTLEKIAKSLCEEQSEFLIKGLPHFNSKLTQGNVAEKIGMHESTVSRAMSGKFVLIPSGEILSFDFFFDSSVRPKEYIKNIIAREDAQKTTSDKDICEMLKEKGIILARRTVAKYREELKIPSSYDRRRT